MPHIWVPRGDLLENTRELVLPASQASGYFRIVGRRADGRTRVLAEMQKNLILDIGLERWGTGSIIDYCVVGSGTTEPVVTQTTLVSRLEVANSTILSTTNGAQASPPYYSWVRRIFRIAPPGSNRNLGEVGFGWVANGTSLWSRSTIKDADGEATIITWLAEETLEVTYDLRNALWPEALTTGTPYTTQLNGVTYAGVMLAANVTSVGAVGQGVCEDSAPSVLIAATYSTNHPYGMGLYGGAIGVVTGTPSGVSYLTTAMTGKTADAYSSNSHKRTGSQRWEGATNLPGEVPITALMHVNGVGTYQMSVSPGIPKIAGRTLVLNFETPTWGRG